MFRIMLRFELLAMRGADLLTHHRVVTQLRARVNHDLFPEEPLSSYASFSLNNAATVPPLLSLLPSAKIK